MIGSVILAALALVAAPGASGAASPPASESNGIIYIAPEDPEMNAAIAKGVASLPQFYQRLAQPGPGEGEFMVKFDIDPSGEVEYVWATDLDRSRSPVTGILINQPVNTRDRQGDRVAITGKRVIDWSYRRGRVVQGGFTNRVLIARMPAEQAAGIREFLGW